MEQALQELASSISNENLDLFQEVFQDATVI